MSIICTCGKASGPMCNGADGCPFNSTYVKADPNSEWKQAPTPDTQLPAEVDAAKWNPNDKERDATMYAAIVVSLLGGAIHKLSTGCNYDAIEYDVRSTVYHFEKLIQTIFPTEYATKLHQAQQEIESLKRWKIEAKQLLNPILDYADNNLKVPLGKSKTDAVIKHINDARDLIEKIVDRYGLRSAKIFYKEIKTFLDGAK